MISRTKLRISGNVGNEFQPKQGRLQNEKVTFGNVAFCVGTCISYSNDGGVDVGINISPAGSYSFSPTTITFSRPATPDGPFDALQIGVRVTDADGPVLAARDMNPATSGACRIRVRSS